MFRPVVQNKQGTTNRDEDVQHGGGSVCKQGSVEGSGLSQEASAKYGILLVSVLCTSFSVKMHDAKTLIFICRIITCVLAKP